MIHIWNSSDQLYSELFWKQKIIKSKILDGSSLLRLDW